MADVTSEMDDGSHGATLYNRYAAAIRALPAGPLSATDVQIPALLMEASGELVIYYAPFDAINLEARVILLGITPGLTQMTLALQRARTLALAGRPVTEVVREARRTAAFGGPMRKNLIRMLDGIGLPQALNITSCESLFAEHADLAHMTSALRYPVFFQGKNYSGYRPRMTRNTMLRRCLLTTLADELGQIPDALIVPMGPSASEALDLLSTERRLDQRRYLIGFPHPSTGPGYKDRKQQYEERRDLLAAQMKAWFSGKPMPSLPKAKPIEGKRQRARQYRSGSWQELGWPEGTTDEDVLKELSLSQDD
jgi:hypothetical protein